MTNLKRDLIKYVRDRAKARYDKGSECFICGSTTRLDFHHYYTLTPLLDRWIRKNRKNPEDVLDFRDDFIREHEAELYEYAVTLCHEHHLKLHSIYGKDPNLGTAKKQMRWVSIQRDKHK
jgi:hypothetical protein